MNSLLFGRGSNPGISFSACVLSLVLLSVVEVLRHVEAQMDEDCRKLVPMDYKKIHPPPVTAAGRPIHVFTALIVMDIDEINEDDMDFRLNTYFTQTWNDSRMRTGYSSSGYILDNCYRHIWTPDINFESAKRVDTLGDSYVYFYVMDDGTLYMTIRYLFKVGCLMDFRMYPFDTQNCLFFISFMQTADTEAQLKWTSDKSNPHGDIWKPVSMLKEIQPLQFNLLHPTVDTGKYEFYIENFTYLIANFTFVRRVTGSIVNIYAPSALIVAVSCVTFWIRVDAAPARVALSVTSLLTLCTQVTQYKSQLPPVNYLTAMDIWLFACIVMVFSTLLEFAISYNKYSKNITHTNSEVTLQLRREKSTHHRQVLEKRSAWHSSDRASTDNDKIKSGCCNFDSVDSLDSFCRKFFPACFLIFIVIYWIYFLKVS